MPLSITMFHGDSNEFEKIRKREVEFLENYKIPNQSTLNGKTPRTKWKKALNESLVISYPINTTLKVYEVMHELVRESRIRIPSMDDPNMIYDQYLDIKSLNAYLYTGNNNKRNSDFNFSGIFFVGAHKIANSIVKRSFDSSKIKKFKTDFKIILNNQNTNNISGAWTKVEKDHINKEAYYGSHVDLSELFKVNYEEGNVISLLFTYDYNKDKSINLVINRSGTITCMNKEIGEKEMISLYFYFIKQKIISID